MKTARQTDARMGITAVSRPCNEGGVEAYTGGRIAVILEGGPGAGKTSVARELADMLRARGLRACIVGDAARLLAGLLGRLFGDWHRAPRSVIEYLFMGYQLCGLMECSGADVAILDYSLDAPLAYMEADGLEYPRELDGISLEALKGFRVYVFVLEGLSGYGTDEARWEPPPTAQRYSRFLFRRAAALAARLGVPLYVVPEMRGPRERASFITTILLSSTTTQGHAGGGAGGGGEEGAGGCSPGA